ncbi:unnamed protein product [Caenorhabditis angaria]|uniref:ShKT domain-containing protein n=1 Tax=Caenorhabditis angaria TaxID=860376 RepID=A0A9P1N0U1_9PELO|nr:unnamed protein product [Caenorhabditis angaria]
MQKFLIFSLIFGLAAAVDSSTTVTVPTTTAICQDASGVNCQLYISQCSDPNYKPLLSGKCDKTCGFCGPKLTTTKPNTPCVDSASNCVNWVKNGFCTNTFYNCTQRKQYCAKSCNLCNTNC